MDHTAGMTRRTTPGLAPLVDHILRQAAAPIDTVVALLEVGVSLARAMQLAKGQTRWTS